MDLTIKATETKQFISFLVFSEYKDRYFDDLQPALFLRDAWKLENFICGECFMALETVISAIFFISLLTLVVLPCMCLPCHTFSLSDLQIQFS